MLFYLLYTLFMLLFFSLQLKKALNICWVLIKLTVSTTVHSRSIPSLLVCRILDSSVLWYCLTGIAPLDGALGADIFPLDGVLGADIFPLVGVLGADIFLDSALGADIFPLDGVLGTDIFPLDGVLGTDIFPYLIFLLLVLSFKSKRWSP